MNRQKSDCFLKPREFFWSSGIILIGGYFNIVSTKHFTIGSFHFLFLLKIHFRIIWESYLYEEMRDIAIYLTWTIHKQLQQLERKSVPDAFNRSIDHVHKIIKHSEASSADEYYKTTFMHI